MRRAWEREERAWCDDGRRRSRLKRPKLDDLPQRRLWERRGLLLVWVWLWVWGAFGCPPIHGLIAAAAIILAGAVSREAQEIALVRWDSHSESHEREYQGGSEESGVPGDPEAGGLTDHATAAAAGGRGGSGGGLQEFEKFEHCEREVRISPDFTSLPSGIPAKTDREKLKPTLTAPRGAGGPGGPGRGTLKEKRASPGGLGGPMLRPGSAVRSSQGQRPSQGL